MYLTFAEWTELQERKVGALQFGKNLPRNMAAPTGYQIAGQEDEDDLTRMAKTFVGTVATGIGQNVQRKLGPDWQTGDMSVFDTTSLMQREESLDGRSWKYNYEVRLDFFDDLPPVDEMGNIDPKRWNELKKKIKNHMTVEFKKAVYQIYLQEGMSTDEANQHIAMMHPPSGPKVGNPYQDQKSGDWKAIVTAYFPKPGEAEDIIASGNPANKNYQKDNDFEPGQTQGA